MRSFGGVVERFQRAHYQHRLVVIDQADRRRREHLDRVRAGIKESP
jgi:hypothetical protein